MRATPAAGVENKCLFKCVRRKGIRSVMMCQFVAMCVALSFLAVLPSPAAAATLPKDKDTASQDISCSNLRYTGADVPKDPLSGKAAGLNNLKQSHVLAETQRLEAG